MSTNSDVVRSMYDAMARGDIPGLLGALDASVAWTEADGFPYRGTYHGPDAVLQQVLMRLGTEWDGFKAVPHDFVDGGDKIVALGRYSGTYKTTGKSFEADFAHLWTLSEGKVVAFYQYVDSAIVQEALQA